MGKKNEESHFVAGSRISPDKMTPAFSSRALEGFSRAKLRRLPKRHQIPATQSRPVGGRVMGSAEQEGRSRRGGAGGEHGGVTKERAGAGLAGVAKRGGRGRGGGGGQPEEQ